MLHLSPATGILNEKTLLYNGIGLNSELTVLCVKPH